MIDLDYTLEEAAGAEGGFEEEAAYPAFGKVKDCCQESKRRAELAGGIRTEPVSGTYHWGLAPVIGLPRTLDNNMTY